MPSGGGEGAILGRGTPNSGITANSSLLRGAENSGIYLYSSALLRNNDCGNNAYGGAVKTYEGASVVMTGGETLPKRRRMTIPTDCRWYRKKLPPVLKKETRHIIPAPTVAIGMSLGMEQG